VPENTIEALRDAVSIGADALEFDVRTTRDGIPVLMHDPTLDRTTDGRGPVAAVSLAELSAVNAASGRTDWTGPRLRVPTLEQVLDEFRDTPLLIEVKEVAAARPTDLVIRRLGAEQRVVVGSQKAAVMDYFHGSGLLTCASQRDATILLPWAIVGAAPTRLGYDVLSITPQYAGLPVPVVRMAATARRAGVATHVWTVNDPTEATRFWSGGVNGIVTDDPVAILLARDAFVR
jgi:glycerophosphoryl diester phosphodiesterase